MMEGGRTAVREKRERTADRTLWTGRVVYSHLT